MSSSVFFLLEVFSSETDQRVETSDPTPWWVFGRTAIAVIGCVKTANETSAWAFWAVFVVLLVEIASYDGGISEDRFPWIPDQQDLSRNWMRRDNASSFSRRSTRPMVGSRWRKHHSPSEKLST
jgi:hypothetical protein